MQLSGTERITVTAYAYDGLGRQTAITDAEGNTTYLAYDALGRDGTFSAYQYDAVGNREALITTAAW